MTTSIKVSLSIERNTGLNVDCLKLFEHRELFDGLMSQGLLTLAPFVLAQYGEKANWKILIYYLVSREYPPIGTRQNNFVSRVINFFHLKKHKNKYGGWKRKSNCSLPSYTIALYWSSSSETVVNKAVVQAFRKAKKPWLVALCAEYGVCFELSSNNTCCTSYLPRRR